MSLSIATLLGASLTLARAAVADSPTAAPSTQPAARSSHATVTLVSDAATIAAGKPFTVALRFQLVPRWHIYWKDPGDSGLPPSVKWALPDGFVAGELMYPTPKAVKGPAGVNYLYEGEAALLVQITPPADLAPGSSVPISAELKWLECDEDRCVPAKGAVAITLASADAPAANEADRFADWQQKIEAGKTFDPKAAADAAAAH